MKKKLYEIARRAAALARNAKGRLTAVLLPLWVFMSSFPAYASGIGGSKLATGTEQLIKDVTSWLLIVAPLVTVVAVIYYFIRKTVSDEMDQKKWGTRISTAIICCIGVVAASLIINLIIGYYQ
jgi:O-acetyl-ADP-ribose deacetylase (regulator of RNase III)